MKMTRRAWLAQTAIAASTLHKTVLGAHFAPSRTRLIMLGTAGGPTPKKSRAAPSQVIIANNEAYVVDCGNGVARQLTLAGIPLRTLRHVLLTHHHSDHNGDYGTLLLLAWSSGLRTRIDTWGPPPLLRINRLFFEMSKPDLKVREADEGMPPLVPLIHAHELTEGGHVLANENMKIRCALVNHPLVKPAFAYRFDAPDRSIVISGDTTRSTNLIALARGADVLVHEVLYMPAVESIAGSAQEAASLKKHLVESHTALEEVGRIAAEADVKTLVLSHFVPAETPPISDEVWLQGAQASFKGQVIAAKDLMEI